MKLEELKTGDVVMVRIYRDRFEKRKVRIIDNQVFFSGGYIGEYYLLKDETWFFYSRPKSLRDIIKLFFK